MISKVATALRAPAQIWILVLMVEATFSGGGGFRLATGRTITCHRQTITASIMVNNEHL
jgi:hypothetical protein